MARHPIRFGLQTGQQNIEWKELLAIWQKADSWGYHSLWNFDHFYPIFADPQGPCLESWTTLSALAQATKRARIGSLVNGNTYRNPALTAKMAASLDHISGGRLNLGIGAGWFEHEHSSLGFDFKTIPGRLAALDEACQIIRGMFTQPATTLNGKHYRVAEALCLPKPIQKAGPPIMIGGTGKKVLLRIVAKYADMWNAMGSTETMHELIGIIAQHGDKVGRDHTQIENTVATFMAYNAPPERIDMLCMLTAQMRGTTPEAARAQLMVGNKQECLDTVERYSKIGVTHFIFMLIPPYHVDEIQGFAEDVIGAVS